LNRKDLEHVIKAAAEIVEDEIVVVGSQSVLGTFPNAPQSLLRSQEADVFPRSKPERADVIDGAIGDGSPFHAEYGYYAHGVGPESVHAPAGWLGRLVRLEVPPFRKNDPPVIGWALEVHDLVLAKLVAGRPHDMEFVTESVHAELVDVGRLRRGLDLMTPDDRELAEARLNGLLGHDEQQQGQTPFGVRP